MIPKIKHKNTYTKIKNTKQDNNQIIQNLGTKEY